MPSSASILVKAVELTADTKDACMHDTGTNGHYEDGGEMYRICWR